MSNEIATTGPSRLLELAVQQNLDVEKLGKLMEMQAEWERRQAKKEFDRAKADFQHSCPKVNRSKTVEFKSTKYSYAPLSEITETIKETLKACGFSYRWDISNGEGYIGVTCHLTHEGGHCESNMMQAPADDSGAKNIIQQYGSTVTYLQRYTLLGVLGITSADEDDDGRGSGELNIEQMISHMDAVKRNYMTVADIKMLLDVDENDEAFSDNVEAARAKFKGIDQDDQMLLWRAPTKGSIWTTEERARLKSGNHKRAAA